MGVYLSKVFESCFMMKDDNIIKGKLQVMKMENISKEVTSPLKLIELFETTNYWYDCCKNSNDVLERLNHTHNGIRNLFSSLDELKKIKGKFTEWNHVIESICSNKEMNDAEKISSINDTLSDDSMFKFLTTNGKLKNDYNIRMNIVYESYVEFYKLYKKKAINCFNKDKKNFCITLAKLYDILSVMLHNQKQFSLFRIKGCNISYNILDMYHLHNLLLSSNVQHVDVYSTWLSKNMFILEGMIDYIETLKKEYMKICFKYSISKALYLKYNQEYFKKFTDHLNMCSDNIFYRLPSELQVHVAEYLVDPNLQCPNIRYIASVHWSDKKYITRYQKKSEVGLRYKVGDEIINIYTGNSWGKIVSINYKNKCVELSNRRIAKFNKCGYNWIPSKYFKLFYISRPSIGRFKHELIWIKPSTSHKFFKFSKHHKEERSCFKKYILQKYK